MTIRVVRNDAGNCVNFYGTSNPTYWNACLTAEEDATYPDHINIRNDIRTVQLGEEVYEFYQLPYTSFVRADNSTFANVTEAVEYITAAANVLGSTGTFAMDVGDVLHFTKTPDGTTILVDNGDAFGLGSIFAVEVSGSISIRDHTGNKDLYVNGTVTSFTYNGTALTADLTTAINELNAYFQGTALGNGAGNNQSTITVDGTDHLVTAYFIESPDGAFTYPIFDNADDAALVKKFFSGNDNEPQVWAYTWPDEPTGAIWYVPAQGAHEGVAGAPADGGDFVWNEIPTEADHLHAPAPLNMADQSFGENQVINLQLVPQGSSETVNVVGLPIELTYNNGFIVGTTRYVAADTDYNIQVLRTNSYGTTTDTFTISYVNNTILDLLSGWIQRKSDSIQLNPNTILEYSPDALFDWAYPLSPGEQITWTQGNNNTPTSGPGTFMHFGIMADGIDKAVADPGVASNWALKAIFWDNALNTSNHGGPVGWDNNSMQYHGDNANTGAVYRLVYEADNGPLKLYRNGTLVITSADNYTGDQTLSLFIPDGHARNTQTPALVKSVAGSGTDQAPTGFVSPIDTGEMGGIDILGQNDGSASVFLTEGLKRNHRWILTEEWVEANVLPLMNDDTYKFFVGVPDPTQAFDHLVGADWDIFLRIHKGTQAGTHRSQLYESAANQNEVVVASLTDAMTGYALEWDGTDLHLMADYNHNLLSRPGVNNGGTFYRTISRISYNAYAGQDELPIAMGVNETGQVRLTMSGIQQIRIPLGPNDILVGEDNSGSGDFKVLPNATQYDAHAGGHAPSGFTFNDVTTLTAGQTYRFLYHPSMEADDKIEFRLSSDLTTVYTTGITEFGSGDPDFTSEYKGITFTVPTDAPPLHLFYYNEYSGGYYDSGRPITISGSTYTVPVNGITLEGPSANQSAGNLFNANTHGWASVDEELGAGERIVFSGAFLQDLAGAMPDNSDMYIGLKGNGWTDAYSGNFMGGTYLYMQRISASDVQYRLFCNSNSTPTYTTSVTNIGLINVILEVTNSGNNIRIAHKDLFDFLDASTTAYDDWPALKKLETGDQGYGITNLDVMILASGTSGNSAGMNANDVDWTGLSEVAAPQAGYNTTTPYTKAIDFSGGAERCVHSGGGTAYDPVSMGGLATTVTHGLLTTVQNNSQHPDARPWAVSCVFKPDNHASNQHIWNQGEGAGSTDDNIYLRQDASHGLYFGWGRDGDVNELYLGDLNSSTWYGVCVTHTGARMSANDATAQYLAAAFDVWITSSAVSWALPQDMSTPAGWEHANSSIGARMDHAIGGEFTIGGRGGDRNFHGKVASCVVTTLRLSVPVPTAAEAKFMTIDPVLWLNNYKHGESYRLPDSQYDTSGFQYDTASTNIGMTGATQVWLMGDGVNDAYATIRNEVRTNSSSLCLDMISMVSNDIETVTIPYLH